ncbi:hypothetical protein AXF42_Ash014302 [Apostasia shenzhenica]|uniref:Uncharacterized protein n=1 Tax=Apostasia shenzhenica TaxID=1088818 RepID=A0A2I0B0R5_9ASPA|nr:hypothetical protein AXF42_Ash014302 [Apostasia shenzhenica]
MNHFLVNQTGDEISDNGKQRPFGKRPFPETGLDTNIIELQQGNHFPLDFNVGTTTDKFKHIPHIDMMGTKGLHGSANPDIGFKVFMDQTKELQSDMHKLRSPTKTILQRTSDDVWERGAMRRRVE